MRQHFSSKWNVSVQARKQRKYMRTAPKHVRQRLMHTNLSQELRDKYDRRSFPVRAGDKVKVMRGTFKGRISKVTGLNLKSLSVYVEDVKRKKEDGKEIQIPIKPSNLQIISLEMGDKKRIKISDRKKPAKK
ncbi:MAG: 50S ribosomal protein L24 [Candidatus Aenigmatarchaeota archaeon]|nr:MAG: 50S ribosomal protein L24 [Candidatus Aenigmarchaeota archaeon]